MRQERLDLRKVVELLDAECERLNIFPVYVPPPALVLAKAVRELTEEIKKNRRYDN